MPSQNQIPGLGADYDLATKVIDILAQPEKYKGRGDIYTQVGFGYNDKVPDPAEMSIGERLLAGFGAGTSGARQKILDGRAAVDKIVEAYLPKIIAHKEQELFGTKVGELSPDEQQRVGLRPDQMITERQVTQGPPEPIYREQEKPQGYGPTPAQPGTNPHAVQDQWTTGATIQNPQPKELMGLTYLPENPHDVIKGVNPEARLSLAQEEKRKHIWDLEKTAMAHPKTKDHMTETDLQAQAIRDVEDIQKGRRPEAYPGELAQRMIDAKRADKNPNKITEKKTNEEIKGLETDNATRSRKNIADIEHTEAGTERTDQEVRQNNPGGINYREKQANIAHKQQETTNISPGGVNYENTRSETRARKKLEVEGSIMEKLSKNEELNEGESYIAANVLTGAEGRDNYVKAMLERATTEAQKTQITALVDLIKTKEFDNHDLFNVYQEIARVAGLDVTDKQNPWWKFWGKNYGLKPSEKPRQIGGSDQRVPGKTPGPWSGGYQAPQMPKSASDIYSKLGK